MAGTFCFWELTSGDGLVARRPEGGPDLGAGFGDGRLGSVGLTGWKGTAVAAVAGVPIPMSGKGATGLVSGTFGVGRFCMNGDTEAIIGATGTDACSTLGGSRSMTMGAGG